MTFVPVQRRGSTTGIIAFALLFFMPQLVRAHAGHSHSTSEAMHEWEFDPGIVIPLIVSGLAYAIGLTKLWKAAGVDHGIRRWEAGSFALGWISLVVALVSPIHPLGGQLFFVHMIQHEILMLIAAPLLVLGLPMIVFLRALPAQCANALGRLSNRHMWKRCWRAISNPLSAWFIHAIMLWGWHAPVLMNLVVTNEFVHALQHLCFFGSALLFWWSVIHNPQRSLAYGMAIVYMFTTALHSTALGVLLTFSRTNWYSVYDHSPQVWGLSPAEDQQLGGLIMWIPAGVVYIVAGVALMAAWMRESDVRSRDALLKTITTATAPAIVLLVSLSGIGCDQQNSVASDADNPGQVEIGKNRIAALGCASCHVVPGIPGADGIVGPSLDHIASRSYLGGVLANTPSNMSQWIQNPRQFSPKTAMPNLHIDAKDANDITAYLQEMR